MSKTLGQAVLSTCGLGSFQGAAEVLLHIAVHSMNSLLPHIQPKAGLAWKAANSA